jgi:tetratricopeptide (TPR) repeat protein
MSAVLGLTLLLWVVQPSHQPTAADPLQVTRAMGDWARRAVGPNGTAEQKLRRLHHALIAPTFGLREQDLLSSTAIETFTDRRANCVGFALLLAGLARELQLPYFFVVFEQAEPGDLAPARQLRFQQGHLAVGFGAAERPLVFDFGGESRPARGFRAVSERTALSIYFSNRGVEALTRGDVRTAISWLERAKDLEQGLSAIWLNLGVALRRSGDLDAAEAAYRRAAALDGESIAVWRNLAQLLTLRLADRGLPTCRREGEALNNRNEGP